MNATTETAAQVIRTIKFLRERRGWNQAALAAEMGKAGVRWHQSVVSKVESGKRRLTVDEVVRLADVFDVDVAVLFVDPRRMLPEMLGPVDVTVTAAQGGDPA